MEERRELAQRCRPKHFSEMWGNRESIAKLEALVARSDRPQTYLFYGHAGCGKTTAARVFCNELGMTNIDIMEINASDKNGVDDIRELIDRLQYSGISGNCRAVILDEGHQLSGAAMSAALKLLEEPPKDVYFFICTTDPHKLTDAIKSRCVQVEMKPLTVKGMVMALKRLVASENLVLKDDNGADMPVSGDVLQMIAEKSEGEPRRALKMLDEVLNLDEVSAMKIIEMKNTASEDGDPNIRKLCQMLLNRSSWKDVAAVLKDIRGGDAEGARRMILGYMASVLTNSGDAKAAVIISYFADSFFNSGYGGLVYACYAALDELNGK